MTFITRAALCAVACAPGMAMAQEAAVERPQADDILVRGTREQGYRATVAPPN